MQRNAQMNLKDWMWINHLWLNYTDAEEREPHIITSHTVSLSCVCLSSDCLPAAHQFCPWTCSCPSRVWRGTWSACVSLPVPVCSLPVCRSDRSSSGSVSEGKPHLCHTSVRLPPDAALAGQRRGRTGQVQLTAVLSGSSAHCERMMGIFQKHWSLNITKDMINTVKHDMWNNSQKTERVYWTFRQKFFFVLSFVSYLIHQAFVAHMWPGAQKQSQYICNNNQQYMYGS